ncbi:MAG: hypothetical protein KKE62_08430 [Proteobacteria bacterium]|nr:hypothetical protein [Pseudomonadota bacterium]MBU1388320.1 hypothetical protein [Pseudomonadota bacterium]MBU1542862.1 hypothetical protein [Pseudomonadota bacterium]MBU2431420.1 hypothetical protein [Pseudomonadota bacterium]MBU2483068.1 hypothetical protein [Pseudomonadota bacterium]
MKKLPFTFCLIMLVSLFVFSENAIAGKKVVVFSASSKARASQEVGYTEIYSGINEGFAPTIGDITLEYQWLEIGALADATAKEAAGKLAIAQIKAVNPDLVIIIGDDNLRYVGQNIKDIPVVFAWLFSPIESYKGLPQKNITGIIQKFYTMDAWALAREILGAKTVSMVSSENDFMIKAKETILANVDPIEAGIGIRFKEMYLVKTFEEWKQAINTTTEDFIYLGDTSRILKDGKEMSRTEIVSWTMANAKKPVVASAEYDVADGALFSIVTSNKTSGNNAAKIAMEILIDGTSPENIPYMTNAKGRLAINSITAQKLNIEIPYRVLSLAEKIYE